MTELRSLGTFCSRAKIALVAQMLVACALEAQQPTPSPLKAITRQEAIDGAVQRGARLALARAEASAARAAVVQAHIVPNPSFSAEYTKSAPQRHATLDWPIDLPWLRSRRI